MMLYRFDKKLRLLLFNEIEKIEVAVRSAIVKHGCEVTGDPFWMTNPNNFSNPVKFNKTKENLFALAWREIALLRTFSLSQMSRVQACLNTLPWRENVC